ncbi:MAG: Rab family GTPase [Candidatus Hermodarchaeota archaeon]
MSLLTSPDAFPERTFVFKVIIVGEGGVGKTSMCMRATRNTFCADYKLTIGTAFFSHEFDLKEIDANVAIQIWDLGGQKKFGSILRSFTQNAKGAILAFDISSMDSFSEIVNRWKPFLKSTLPDVPVVLASTKHDLPVEERIISEGLIREFIETEQKSNGLNIISYLPTSSKFGLNVHECFTELAKAILKI